MTLRTAHFSQAVSDVGTSDQGDDIGDGFVYFCIKHTPWSAFGGALDGELDGLAVPSDISEDWNREIPHNSIPDVWESVEYEKRYKRHLNFDAGAKRSLDKIDFLEGEKDICIVCTCSDSMYRYCPRRIVYEHYQENIA